MNAPDAQDGAPVRFGIILLPDFTLTAFSGLVDVLRLASDEGDNSRPRRCSWEILGENPQPVRASCGVQIAPWSLFGRPDAYDYLVVVGGLLRATPEISKATLDFIRAAGGSRTTLVGVCTGAFALMRAGVLDGHRVCVSWFHYWDFLEQFPQADANLLVADRLYVEDRRRITCSGGRASIDVGRRSWRATSRRPPCRRRCVSCRSTNPGATTRRSRSRICPGPRRPAIPRSGAPSCSWSST